jgi:hypothetical protein
MFGLFKHEASSFDFKRRKIGETVSSELQRMWWIAALFDVISERFFGRTPEPHEGSQIRRSLGREFTNRPSKYGSEKPITQS